MQPSDPAMFAARHLVEEHIRIWGMVPHPDKMKEAIALAIVAERDACARIYDGAAKLLVADARKMKLCDGCEMPRTCMDHGRCFSARSVATN